MPYSRCETVWSVSSGRPESSRNAHTHHPMDSLASLDPKLWTIEVPRGMGLGPIDVHVIRLHPKGARWMIFMEVGGFVVISRILDGTRTRSLDTDLLTN